MEQKDATTDHRSGLSGGSAIVIRSFKSNKPETICMRVEVSVMERARPDCVERNDALQLFDTSNISDTLDYFSATVGWFSISFGRYTGVLSMEQQ